MERVANWASEPDGGTIVTTSVHVGRRWIVSDGAAVVVTMREETLAYGTPRPASRRSNSSPGGASWRTRRALALTNVAFADGYGPMNSTVPGREEENPAAFSVPSTGVGIVVVTNGTVQVAFALVSDDASDERRGNRECDVRGPARFRQEDGGVRPDRVGRVRREREDEMAAGRRDLRRDPGRTREVEDDRRVERGSGPGRRASRRRGHRAS